jgi:predicted ArsR family transcriptional regulator
MTEAPTPNATPAASDPRQDYKAMTRLTLKRLRGERETQVKAANEASKSVRAERKRLAAALSEGAMSVPQLAAAIEMSTDRVLWHLAAMRKYGDLVEAPERDGDYFTYALAPKDEATEAKVEAAEHVRAGDEMPEVTAAREAARGVTEAAGPGADAAEASAATATAETAEEG